MSESSVAQTSASASTVPVPHTRSGFGQTIKHVLTSYPYLILATFFFVGWQILPITSSLRLSFTDDKFLDQENPNFIGLQNYRDVLGDHLFWQGIERALIFTLIFLPGMIFIPMITAIFIDRIRNERIATVYRIILLIPAMIPAPLIFVLWLWMYNNYIGPINYILVDKLHLVTINTQPQWLSDPKLIFLSIAAMEWWWGLGYHTMFFLAGLATIPKDLPDAARVDGAGEWRMFWGITVWRLLPILLVLMVVRFGSAMAVITEYIIMGGYDRTKNTYTWTVYMYDTAFNGGVQFRGYAAAIGWMGAILMLIVVAFMFYIFRPRD
jgi:multiple sugar transport system permease protein